MNAKSVIPASLRFLLAMTFLLGMAYPLVVTGIAQVAFPKKANGSLLVIDGGVRGSTLLSQEFGSKGFFRARPSATGHVWAGAGSSNQALTNPALATAVEDRRRAWASTFAGPAPTDMLHASASGLDPDISLEAALGQLPSVAAARGLDASTAARLESAIRSAVASKTTLLGPSRLNVVALNASLATEPAYAAKK